MRRMMDGMNRLTALDHARTLWGPSGYAEYFWVGGGSPPHGKVSYGTGAARREFTAATFEDAFSLAEVRQFPRLRVAAPSVEAYTPPPPVVRRRVERKFQLGDRVQLTADAPGKRVTRTGVVVGLGRDEDMISVLRDGLKSVVLWSQNYWELEQPR